MKACISQILVTLVLSLALNATATVRYVDLNSTNATQPFTDWSTAATNIQDAIDAAVDGDQILVTDGVYQTGGKVMAGDLTNRVALDKAITVQSVNGPWVTIIQGAGATNGTTAVRCAWLTNGASLVGFTLQGGGTRSSGDTTTLLTGGGAWCASSSATVANCLIISNTAYNRGSGGFRGTINNSYITGNFTPGYTGSAAENANLNSCTIVSNTGYAVASGRLTNCIAYYNDYNYYSGCLFSYSCTTPAASGAGNFTTAPQFFADGVHLSLTSPCIGAGTNLTTGTDVFGRAWADPPSVGCAEWQPGPVVTRPQVRLNFRLTGFTVGNAAIGGQPPFSYEWLKDGVPLQEDGHFSATQTANLVATGFSLSDVGAYQLVVSNASGVVTSSAALLVIHCVDAAGANPVAPYSTWATAATNIQDANDVAVDGDQILVTNGVYETGGRVMAGDLTNRVALTKAVTVQSVNGPWLTVIRGASGPGLTNGTTAVRCVWLTNSASLVGFTLQGGATRRTGDATSLLSGGGVWCASRNATVANCLIISNAAHYQGGGVFQGTVDNCYLSGNSIFSANDGGAAYAANLNNCTVVSNTAYASAVYSGRLTNCIVYYNNCMWDGASAPSAYCCSATAVSGTGNFTAAPRLFVDAIHLGLASPCIGAGTNRVTGTDLFGNAWANPPSVGCAEWRPEPLAGQPQLNLAAGSGGFTVSADLCGQPPFSCWWLKDGVVLQDDGHFTFAQTTNLVVSGIRFSDAGNYQLVVSNAAGVVTSSVTPLVIHCVDAASANPVAPYTTWATAANNIQDAITAAAAGEIVLVTNGLYVAGGKSMDGVITNRVCVDKAITVQSVNGPDATLIQGAWDVSTNGPGAVRCAWLTNNAVLSGFTLRGGATRVVKSPGQSAYGGGVWGSSTNALVHNCAIVSNYAGSQGGGAYQVTLNRCTLSGNCAVGSSAGYPSAGCGGGAARCAVNACSITANTALQSDGGGVYFCNSRNCVLSHNRAILYGSAACLGTLVNCTVFGNLAGGYSSQSGAVANASLTNCIVRGNLTVPPGSSTNYYSCTFSYCNTWPLPPGTGNIDVDPQCLADGFHLAESSPCRGAGTSAALAGTDIDGQPWLNPPSIGCDEWRPEPVIGAQRGYQVDSPPQGLTFNVVVAGQAPLTCYWSKDGSLIEDDEHYGGSATARLSVQHFGPEHAGMYELVVSNAFGVATSQVAQVVIHAVHAAGTNPVPPYSTWATAATNIQDAIDAASAGDIVLVTNGVYGFGGKVMGGDLTNRVALDKALTLTSVNGCWETVIQGAWDPASTNGPGAVRCAWLTNNAVLHGFTLQNGATRSRSGYVGAPLESGGGTWCASTNALVSNCVLTNNRAIYGGGIASGTLINSLVIDNVADNGGGAYCATLNNCTVLDNWATTASMFPYYGAGTYNCAVRNSIVLRNYDGYPYGYPYGYTTDNYYYSFGYPSSSPKYSFSCTAPLVPGTGNIDGSTFSPVFLGLFHISSISSCRGTGSALYATGFDMDGEPWTSPPSMGCDEVLLSNLAGSLSVSIMPQKTNCLASAYVSFSGTITGRAGRVEWSFGDGPAVTNKGTSVTHQWISPGDYMVSFTAFNSDNPGGVTTNLTVQVLPLATPLLQAVHVQSNSFGFQFTGQTDATYRVQYATSLVPPVAWQNLQTFWLSTGQVYQIQDPMVTNGVRFYRVQAGAW